MATRKQNDSMSILLQALFADMFPAWGGAQRFDSLYRFSVAGINAERQGSSTRVIRRDQQQEARGTINQ
jgi:hypothetical protein